VHDRSGFCDEHRQAWRTTTKRTHERGYGADWRKVRLEVLQRDSYLCQPHRKIGKLVEAREVDHIVNKASGGTDDPSNLQAICRECHRTKTISERRASRPNNLETQHG
jgi:5-methylcytosine-specific restriction protein A